MNTFDLLMLGNPQKQLLNNPKIIRGLQLNEMKKINKTTDEHGTSKELPIHV